MAVWRRSALAVVLVLGLAACDRTDRSFGDGGVVRVGVAPAEVLPLSGTTSFALVGRRDTTTSVRVSRVDVDGRTAWQRDLPATFAGDPAAGAAVPLSSPRDPSHRIAIVGYDARAGAGGELLVAMLHESGPMVGDYGVGGVASTGVAFDESSRPRAVAGDDGRLTVIVRDAGDVVLVGLSPTGVVESVSRLASSIVVHDAVATDHGILVSGTIPHVSAGDAWTSSDLALMRLTQAGTLDPTFGDGGTATVSPGTFNVAHALAVRSDGRIVAAGNTTSNGRTRVLLAGFRSDGTPDGSFGLYGLSIADAVESSFVSIALGGPGIVVASSGNGDVVTNGFDSNGVAADSWGDRGRQVDDLGTDAIATGIALVPHTCLHGACSTDARFIVTAMTGAPPGALVGLTP